MNGPVARAKGAYGALALGAAFGLGAVLALGAVLVLGAARPARAGPPTAQERAAIERLRQLDVAATLSGRADDLAKLWDADAVRLGPAGPAEVGRDVITGHDRAWEKTNTTRTLAYRADLQDVQVSGDSAIEWGTFEVTVQPTQGAAPLTIHGKLLRALKRQSDGEWKFARVMGLADARPRSP